VSCGFTAKLLTFVGRFIILVGLRGSVSTTSGSASVFFVEFCELVVFMLPSSSVSLFSVVELLLHGPDVNLRRTFSFTSLIPTLAAKYSFGPSTSPTNRTDVKTRLRAIKTIVEAAGKSAVTINITTSKMMNDMQ